MKRSIPVRKTVNLSPEDYEDLAPFLDEESREHAELAAAVGEEGVAYSESGALAALARVGARVVRDRILDRGYRELARSQGPQDDAFLDFAWGEVASAWADEP